jgi:hypothetical protein
MMSRRSQVSIESKCDEQQQHLAGPSQPGLTMFLFFKLFLWGFTGFYFKQKAALF